MARGSSAAYGRFAGYYDFIYHDLVDYVEDVRFLEAVFHRWMKEKPRTILDLGCGTGNHDLPLARRGYRVTGLDLSPHQLAMARRKARRARLPIRFLQSDMRSFDLGTTFDAVICMFGAFGYLLNPSDAVGALRSVRRHVRPDGLFVYEFWQSSGVLSPPFQSWFHKVGEEYELVRLSESRFDAKTQLLPIEFRFFVFKDGKVRDRFDETHTVRTYPMEGMRALLRRGGFRLLAACAATNTTKGFEPVRRDTFRVMAVARPRGPNQS